MTTDDQRRSAGHNISIKALCCKLGDQKRQHQHNLFVLKGEHAAEIIRVSAKAYAKGIKVASAFASSERELLPDEEVLNTLMGRCDEQTATIKDLTATLDSRVGTASHEHIAANRQLTLELKGANEIKRCLAAECKTLENRSNNRERDVRYWKPIAKQRLILIDNLHNQIRTMVKEAQKPKYGPTIQGIPAPKVEVKISDKGDATVCVGDQVVSIWGGCWFFDRKIAKAKAEMLEGYYKIQTTKLIYTIQNGK